MEEKIEWSILLARRTKPGSFPCPLPVFLSMRREKARTLNKIHGKDNRPPPPSAAYLPTLRERYEACALLHTCMYARVYACSTQRRGDVKFERAMSVRPTLNGPPTTRWLTFTTRLKKEAFLTYCCVKLSPRGLNVVQCMVAAKNVHVTPLSPSPSSPILAEKCCELSHPDVTPPLCNRPRRKEWFKTVVDPTWDLPSEKCGGGCGRIP